MSPQKLFSGTIPFKTPTRTNGKLIATTIVRIIIDGSSLPNALATAGGTPAGILISSLPLLASRQNNSVATIETTIAVSSPVAPIRPGIPAIDTKNAARDNTPAINGASEPLTFDKKYPIPNAT